MRKAQDIKFKEVCKLVSKGYTISEACRDLGINPSTFSGRTTKEEKRKLRTVKAKFIASTLKVCPVCKEAKPRTSKFFGKSNRLRLGLVNICRPCQTARNKKFWEDNPDKRAKLIVESRRERKRNPEKWKEQQRKRIANMSDGYLAGLLGVRATEIPSFILELKRKELWLKRRLQTETQLKEL